MIRLHGEVEDGVVDAAVDPAADAGIRLRQGGISRARRDNAINVAEEAELGAHGGEERLPLGVVWALQAEVDRHVLMNGDGGIRVDEDRRSGGVRRGRRKRSAEGR